MKKSIKKTKPPKRGLTDHLHVEPSLRNSELRYRRLFETAQDGILILDAKTGAITDVNPYLIAMLGYSRAEFVEKKLWEVGAFQDVQASKDAFEALQQNEYIRYENLPLKAKDGRLIQVEFVSNVYLVGDEQVIQCNIRDITEHKRLVAALQENEREYRALVISSPDGLFLIDLSGNFSAVNKAMCDELGFSEAELCSMNIWDIVPDQYLDQYRKRLTRILNGEILNVPAEYTVRGKDGKIIYIEVISAPYYSEKGIIGFQGIARDITARKRAEESLRESEERFRAWIESSSDVVTVVGLDGTIKYESPSIEHLLGYKPEELIGTNAFDLMHPDDRERVMEIFAQNIASPGSATRAEFRFRHRDGSWRVFEGLGKSYLDKHGQMAGLINSRGITERKRAEQEISSLAKFPSENPNPVLRLSRDGIVMYANAASNALLGMWECAVGGTAPQFWRDLAAQALASGENKTVDIECDGKVYSMFVTPVAEEGYVNLYGRDITERKRAEEALRESEEQFRSTFEQAAVGMAQVALDGRYLRFNQRLCDIVGYTRAELLTKMFQDITHPDDLGNDVANLHRLLANEIQTYATEKRYIRKGGQSVWINLTVSLVREPTGTPKYFVSVIEDITERKQAEEALRESENRLRTIVEGTQALLLSVDANGHFTYANDATARAVGYASPAELIGKPYLHFVHPEDRQQVLDTFINQFNTRQPSRMLEFRITDTAGKVKWFSFLSTLTIKDGQVVSQSGVAQDITERKRAEEEIIRMALMLDTAPNSITVHDFDGRFVYANQRTFDLHGFNRDEFLALNLRQLDVPESGNRIAPRMQELLDRGEATFESAHYRKDGSTVSMEITARVTTWGDKKVILSIATDITERKRAEEEIRRRANEFAALYDTARDLVEHHDLPTLLGAIVDRAATLLAAPCGGMYLYDKTRGDLHVAVSKDTSLPIGARVQIGEGMAGRVAQSHQPLIVNDYRTWEGRSPQYEGIPIAATIEVPMILGGELIGVLVVFEMDKAARKFTDTDARLLSLFAGQAAGAVHNARLHDETVRQLGQLEASHSIDIAISASMDLQMTLNILLEHVKAQLNADAASVLLLNPHSQTLEYAAGRGFRTRSVQNTRIRLGEHFAGRAALERRAVQAGDPAQIESSHFAALWAGEGFAAYFGVPLIAKGEVKGVLEVYHRAPFHPESDWISFLETLAGQAAIAVDSAQLFENLQRSNADLSLAYDATIEGWSHALDLRDKETEGHTLRVTEITMRLAKVMGIADAELVHVRRGGLLHDIGKMGVPDELLLKPGKLTDEEWVLMRKHPQLAYDLLSPINYLHAALDIPYCHHEKWDGTGYPRGLKGEQIPLAARLFAVVDVWDALRSDRPYRAAWAEEQVLEHIRSLAGTHFDPQVVQVCLESGVLGTQAPE